MSYDYDYEDYNDPVRDDYLHLVLEPVDEMISERRLAPVAVISEAGFIDLVNSPRRISLEESLNTFHLLVRAGRAYDVYSSEKI